LLSNPHRLAIHVFRGHTVYEHADFGNFYDYSGVPNAWGFLMFCAAWTVLLVVFNLIAGHRFATSVWIGYTCVAIETVAALSWLAGFVAVAVQISTSTCSAGNSASCRLLKVATVFGALEWMLSAITTFLTIKLVFYSNRRCKSQQPVPLYLVDQPAT
jgi:hypothetical protein